MNAQTPEDCDRLFGERTNAADLDGLVSLYEPHATFVPQEGEPVTGTDGIRQALAALVAMRPKIQMHVAKVVRAGDDLAVLYNDWRLTGIGPDGAAVNMAGKAIEIVRRQSDGTWRFAVDDPFARS